MDLETLSRRDRVTFKLGQIVQAAVTLDAAARSTLTTLQRSPEDAAYDAGRQLTTILKTCELVLTSRTDLPGDVTADGTAALLEAQVAYNERHRYVHDQLRYIGAEAWNRLRLERTKGAALPDEREVSYEDIRKAHLDLVWSEWRLHALRLTVALADGIELPDADPTAWRAILAGSFEVDEDGGASWITTDD